MQGSRPVALSPEEDIAVLQYTGETTGTPKAAMLTHYNLVVNIVQMQELLTEWVEEKKGKQSYVVAALPFSHAYGMTVVMNLGLCLSMGLLLMHRFNVEEFLRLVQSYQPVLFCGVPTMYTAIINHPRIQSYKIDCIEICNSGGAPMPLEVIKNFEALTGAAILEGYGLSEAAPSTHTNPLSGVRKPGSIGLPYPDTDCRIVDPDKGNRELPPGSEGELIIKGPQVMKGYWRQPDETREVLRNGWLYTGDIAKMDEDGYFYIVDRKKDMVITSGFNVYPREVDEVLFQHPKVAEAVTLGVPHDYHGEVLKAFVVLKEGKKASEEEIIAFCAERLVKYKLPRVVEFSTELPKSAVGKILRHHLRK